MDVVESTLIKYLERNIPGDDSVLEENKLEDLIDRCKTFFAETILIEYSLDINLVRSVHEEYSSRIRVVEQVTNILLSKRVFFSSNRRKDDELKN